MHASAARFDGPEIVMAPAGAGTARESGWKVQDDSYVTVDGRVGRLFAYDDCGTTGCMFELRLGSPPDQKTLFQTTAKTCSVLRTRSAGYPDIECVQVYSVEARGVSSIRVTNRYRWNGVSYTSPLAHLNDGAKPVTPAPCHAVQMTEAADVLILPAQGVRVSEPKREGARGWKTGPARTPVIGRVVRGSGVRALEQVTSAETGVWLLVRLDEHSAGWVKSRQTRCVRVNTE
jgi:hypothetical protein